MRVCKSLAKACSAHENTPVIRIRLGYTRETVMKISFVSSGLAASYGGSAQSESGLVAALSRRAGVQVFCPTERLDTSFAASKGLEFVQPFAASEVRESLRRPTNLRMLLQGSDVLHLNGHWRWENYYWACLAKQMEIPLVLHPRGMFLIGHRRPVLKRLFNFLLGNHVVRSSSAVIALSDFERSHFRGYPLKNTEVVTIPNGIPRLDQVFAAAPEFPPKSYFLYLGRLESRKRLENLIESFASYRATGGARDLVLLGPSERGYGETLKLKAGAFGLASAVHFPEPVYDERKWNYVQNACAVVYPTFEEAFGRVPFEAVSAGTFPILPDQSGGAEYLRKLLPFCVYEAKGTDGLVGSLHLLSNENETHLRALRLAREWVWRELKWEKLADRVLALYEKLRKNRLDSSIAAPIDADLGAGSF